MQIMSRETQLLVIAFILMMVLSYLIAAGITWIVCWSFGLVFQWQYVWGAWIIKIWLTPSNDTKKLSKELKKLRKEL